MSPRVLLVDDETNIRRMVGALLQSEEFDTAEAENGTAAVAAVEREAPDAVLLDLMMPGGPDGLTVLEQLKQIAPHVPVIMMSGKANLADAVRATKLGAFQFLEKPLTPEGVLTTLRAAVALSRTLAENRRLHEALGHGDPLVGVSQAMEDLRAMIARVAPTEARVLITGESGTGKELPPRSTGRARGRPSRSYASTVPRSRRTWSSRRCSAMSEERSPERPSDASAASSSPTAARCSWTRWETSAPRPRRSCSGCSRPE